MTFIEIIHGSYEYRKMVELRREILRKPLGLDFTEDELCTENQDILLGAFDGKEIVACCILSDAENQFLKLRQMAVKQELQRIGIGRSLLQFAEKTAWDKGFVGIRLHARTTARNFYEKQGYQADDKLFEEVGIPHIRMEKIVK
jgi:predicted GNAT family N-acyltransferase